MLNRFRKTLSVVVFFTSLFFGHRSHAQQADTLALAQKLTADKAFEDAAALLTSYEKAHPTSTDAVRLHLQLLYWLHQLPKATTLYNSTIGQLPGASSLQLDYGRMLYETKQYPQAKKVLSSLLQKEPDNAEALTIMGTIRYNEGGMPQAQSYFGRALASEPNNATAKALAQKIQAFRIPYLNLYNTYRADDQPLKWIENRLEAGIYRSALFSPSVQAVLWNTQDSSSGFRQHFQVLVGNKSTFLHQKLTLQLNAGVFKHAAQNSLAFVGNATLQYKLPKGFALEAAGSRAPYFYTIASSRNSVLFSQLAGALLFESSKGWQGRAQVTQSIFPGGNHILGLSAWMLSRALTLGPVYLKGGYSFGYNDAQYNTYSPLLSTAEIAATNKPVAGTYGDYFTPQQQFIHSLLLNVDAKVSSRCWLSLKGSVGVYAQAQNPYLFLASNSTSLFIDRGFETEHYTPFELKGQASYALSNHVGLEGGYGHTKSFFYNANQAFVNLKFSF